MHTIMTHSAYHPSGQNNTNVSSPSNPICAVASVLVLGCGFGLRGLGIGCFSILGTVLVLRIKRLGKVNHGAPKHPEI